jgi:hypothetical protein
MNKPPVFLSALIVLLSFFANAQPSGTVEANRISLKRTADTVGLSPKPANRKFGTIKAKPTDVVLYSGSYTRFAKLVEVPSRMYVYDSLLFDERFENCKYKGIYRIDNWQTGYRLDVRKSFIKRKACFLLNYNLKKNKAWKSLINTYPELIVFGRGFWVVEDAIKPYEFRKLYRKTHWNDLRITYNEQDKNFTLLFKGDTSFFTIVAKPIGFRNAKNPEREIASYTELYRNYLRALESRRMKTNKSVVANRLKMEALRKKMLDENWEIFRKNYFSEEERNLSKEEWLALYEEIIADEEKILNQAYPQIDIMERALTLVGFREQKLPDFRGGSSRKLIITDEENHKLAVKELICLIPERAGYFSFPGGMGIENQNLYNDLNETFSLIAVTVSGKIVLVKDIRLLDLTPDPFNNYRVAAKIFDSDLTSVQQVLSFLGYKL